MKFKWRNHEGHEGSQKESATKKPQPEGEADVRVVQVRVVRAPSPARQRKILLRGERFDHHILAHLTAILKHNPARDLGKQRIVLAAADVQPRLHPRTPLPHDNRAAGHKLPAKGFEAEPLRIPTTCTS